MMILLNTHGSIKNVESFMQQLLFFSTEEQCMIQAFDARLIYGMDHLISAVMHAKRAFQQGTNATNSLALEILLYAAGERQIKKAIKKMGIKKGQQQIIFLLTDSADKKGEKFSEKQLIQRLLALFQLTRDEKMPKGNKETLKRFGITDKELSTVPEEKYGDLILERVAMVDVIK
jgi:KEOPS complex subunit Cgi121